MTDDPLNTSHLTLTVKINLNASTLNRTQVMDTVDVTVHISGYACIAKN